MKVSILLAALDPDEVRRTIDDIAATAGDPNAYEIVVCAPFAFDAPRTRFVDDVERRGAAQAYNRAAEAASGDIVAHATDTKKFEPGWLDAALAYLAARDSGQAAFAACLPMFDTAAGDAFVGTAFGRLYPWFYLARRDIFARVGPYGDPALKSGFIDVHFGMRIWASGGRCEIVPGPARYRSIPDAGRIRVPGAASFDAQAADFRVFLGRWYPLYGAGYGVRTQDGRVDVAPWNVCYDVPSLFFDFFVREGTILVRDPDFPRTGAFLRAAATLVRVQGRTMPPDIAADPRRVPDWVQAIAAEKGAG